MQFPIVREYQTSIRGINPENNVVDEPKELTEGLIVWTPRHAPFFVDSLELKAANGSPLVPDVHYRIYTLMSRLTALAGKEVACTIEMLDTNIKDVLVSYKVVGEFSLIDSSMLQLIDAAANDDRPVHWDNLDDKPVVFPPPVHGHSLIYEIVAMQDVVDCLDVLLEYAESGLRKPIEIRVDHYLNLLNNYLKLNKKMLSTFLNNHINAYNAHGLKTADFGLEKVDNFATARGNTLLQGRNDLHVTVPGLKTIIDNYGFNGNEFLPANALPISRFGNTNFIPPSIDGSFEGLGGMYETAGICMETDGSIVFLENRMDGRVDGLYYSVVQTPYDNPKRVYTGYRYNHQRFEADGTAPNFIAQGSGSEVILVADSRKGQWYIGLTNGSLNPSKHVISKLDVSAFSPAINPGGDLMALLQFTSVVLMGDWIYIIMATQFRNGVLDVGTGFNYRYVGRVPKATVEAQLPVAAALVNLTFKDGEGVQWTNSPVWRWGTPIPHPSGFQFLKWYFDFVQTENVLCTGSYRSQQSYVAAIPNKPGKFLLRFTSAWWASYSVPNFRSRYELMLEMVYEFDPATNVMTLLYQTPRYTLDFTNLPSLGTTNLFGLVFRDSCQGAAVLEDGTIVASYGTYQSFPRGMYLWRPKDWKTRYDTMNRQWNTQLGSMTQHSDVLESVLSPLKSTIKARSFILGNGGDFYTTPNPASLGFMRLFYRVGNGRLGQRPEVTNLFYPNVLSRPLSNDVRVVNADPRVGAASVTCPTAQLSTYGIDLAENAFCVGTQKKWCDLSLWEGASAWPMGTDPDDVMLMSGHTRKIETNGTITIVPTGTILYPAAIVNQLKQQVDDVAGMNASPSVFVSICDPTGPLTTKFGWLPVLVHVCWGKVGTTSRRETVMSIQPTYSGGANKTVTGFTVLDKGHFVFPNSAAALTPTEWDAMLWGNFDPNSTHGAQRAGFHVDGNIVTGFFDPAIYAADPGDGVVVSSVYKFDRTTKRWLVDGTSVTAFGQTGGGNHKCIAPDDGVVYALPHNTSTGGAGTIFQGPTKEILYGHTYPATGWILYFSVELTAVFNGKQYTLPSGNIDLRDINPNPANKTFYIYALMDGGEAKYEVSEDKRLESNFQLWVGKAVTNDRQIISVERFNVFAIDGHRVSEVKRGNSIPASSGLINDEGQIPWLRSTEMLP